MQVRGIDFVFSSVSDIEKAKAFYQDVLGIRAPILEDSESWVEYDTHPVALSLGVGASVGNPPPVTAIALAVDDVAAAVEELRAKGVRILMEPMDTPVCMMAQIADPDGNPIFLHKRKDGTVG